MSTTKFEASEASVERAKSANLHAWSVTLSHALYADVAAAWDVAGDAWEEAGEPATARMCHEEAERMREKSIRLDAAIREMYHTKPDYS